MGDPLGIGPEVTLKALADPRVRSAAHWRIYGQRGPLEAAAQAAGSTAGLAGALDGVELIDLSSPALVEPAPTPPRPTAISGAASLAFLEAAIADCKKPPTDAGRARAIVTAPISKEAWSLAGGASFPGHTELLADRFEAPRVRMMFDAAPLRVILVTTHIALSRVPGAISAHRVEETIMMGHGACKDLGVASPRIAVCGVNPHAGENGLFGSDEVDHVTPAIDAARLRGVDVSGPYPGDTIFSAAVKGKFDLVVAMYHDQGLIPVKLLAFDRAVNITVGLPVVRTSPDHGTAYDIAGKNLANPGSMIAAMLLAARSALVSEDRAQRRRV